MLSSIPAEQSVNPDKQSIISTCAVTFTKLIFIISERTKRPTDRFRRPPIACTVAYRGCSIGCASPKRRAVWGSATLGVLVCSGGYGGHRHKTCACACVLHLTDCSV